MFQNLTRLTACICVAYALGLTGCRPDTEEKPPPKGSDPTAQDPTQDDPTGVDPTIPDDISYWRDVQPILAENCLQCHRANEIAPFTLETYADAVAWAEPMRAAVEAGSMPPWPPTTSYQGGPCAELQNPRTLSAQQIAMIGAWVDADTPEGDPADGIEVPGPVAFESDVVLPMPEAYSPVPQSDDYRCFLVDWPHPTPAYITGYQVDPGRADLVHHVILSKATGFAANQATGLDEGEAGPGYTCFGSSGVLGAETIGGWAPGADSSGLPDGTGMLIEPGAKVIMQVHYNTMTTSDPGEDLTTVSFRLADTVEKPAAGLLLLDLLWLLPGQMDIPAGESAVSHETTFTGAIIASVAGSIGANGNEPITLHRAGLHMHTLGKSGALTLEPEEGESSCVLAIPDWDFHWQGSYNLVESIEIGPQDRLRLRCQWDNSGPEAVDVGWGEGTGDEMCLTSLYITQ